jgi:tetratricopeptide (TPR) repeat protein
MASEPVINALNETSGQSDASRLALPVPSSFGTTLSHQAFVLLSSSFCFFELIFLWLYSDRLWFTTDLLFWTLPVAAFTLGTVHLFLRWLESSAGCKLTGFIAKGLPLAPYQRWVVTNESGFEPSVRFGNRRALWSAIDFAEITFFGNVRLLSRASSGAPVIRTARGKQYDANPPQLLFKIPFGIASKGDQIAFLELLRKENPACELNSGLLKQLKNDEPKGAAIVLNVVSLFFLLFYIDVIFSTFSYLELLKNYTLTEESAPSKASAAELASAEAYFVKGEHLRLHPLPISWVTKKMFQSDSAKSGVMQVRADALWAMNRRDEAIASMRDGLEEHGKNFRAELKLARMLVDTHNFKEAYEVLDRANEKSKKAFVPKMYVLALLQSEKSSKNESPEQYYDRAMKSLDEELFKDSAGWPPGVSPYVPDVWHREDIDFVFEKMLHAQEVHAAKDLAKDLNDQSNKRSKQESKQASNNSSKQASNKASDK